MSTNTVSPELQLKKLYDAHRTCSPCTFEKTEENHRVFGEGNARAKLLFIGEAPGADEDRLKRPFVGRAGKLLQNIFSKAGFSREDVFITNVVKCRPPNNRTPLPDEINEELRALLRAEITIVQPRIICTLGTVATRLFFPDMTAITPLRGRMKPVPHTSLIVMPTFHPAYALRSKDAEKALSDDILAAWKAATCDSNGI